MTQADERLKEAKAAKLLAETAAFKIKRGDFITKTEHENALAEQRNEIYRQILSKLLDIPEVFQKAGLLKKDKVPKAADLIKNMMV